MWPERYWPERYWPERYWPEINNFVAFRNTRINTKRLRAERWYTTLINSVGTRYPLGWVDVAGESSVVISIPGSVPDGLYDIEVKTYGMAWEGLVQKNWGSVLLDSGASVIVSEGLPLLTNLRYDIDQGHIRLLWDGEVSPDDSGLVSAGIWLSNGVPDFGTDPTLTIPLFSFDTTHTYTLFEEVSYTHAGVAAIRGDDTGDGSWILLPSRVITDPKAVVIEG